MTPAPESRPLQVPTRRLQAAFSLLILLAAGAAVVAFFSRVPIEGNTLAIDWKGLHNAIVGGQVVYGFLLIAPWAVPVIWPLGFLPLQVSWGVLACLIIVTLALSVPRRPRFGIAAILLLVSFPTVRQIVDGNLEFMIIGGTALVVYGLRARRVWPTAIGILLATAKPQETWILMLAVGLYLLRTWSFSELVRLGAIILAVVIPALLLLGSPWVASMGNMQPPPGSLLDITAWAAIGRLGLPRLVGAVVCGAIFTITLYVMFKSPPTLTRDKAGMLIATALLVSPYAAGGSFLTVFAVGIIPLFQRRPALGGVLIALINVQYVLMVVARDWLLYNGSYYLTALLLFVWGYWAWHLWQAGQAGTSQPQAGVSPPAA